MSEKPGANYSDRIVIKQMSDAGKSSKVIAASLNIVESCVKSFMTEGATDIKVDAPRINIPGLPKSGD